MLGEEEGGIPFEEFPGCWWRRTEDIPGLWRKYRYGARRHFDFNQRISRIGWP